MQVGNMHYLKESDLPKEVRLFPLSGALLLPGSIMPLNIFEPRYLELFDDAMANDRIVAMVQPNFLNKANTPVDDLCSVGTLGRIISIAESGDGRYLISLGGVCRFRLKEELSVKSPYRIAKITPFMTDIEEKDFEMPEAKVELLQHMRKYVDDNNIEVDYEDIEQLQVSDLVNLLSGLLPFDLAEKQALLEADFEVRVQTLIALLEMGFSNDASDSKQTVQ